MDSTQIIPIVPFGKYKGQSVLDLMADEKYVEWLKQQSWFANQKQIYNIVVHQSMPSANDSKTPEHNKLQNLFLDTHNQRQLIRSLWGDSPTYATANNELLNRPVIVRCFGQGLQLPPCPIDMKNTTVMFEDKFNWDVVLYHNDYQYYTINSIPEIELHDKEQYKELYYANNKYNDNLLLIDALIEGRKKLDSEEGCARVPEPTADPEPSGLQPPIRRVVRRHIQTHSTAKSFSLADPKYCELNTLNSQIMEMDHTGDHTGRTVRGNIIAPVDELIKLKTKIEARYECLFNEYYDEHRRREYRNASQHRLDKYDDPYIWIEKTNDIQYQLTIPLRERNYAICCEIKPTLSDDYPVVLRKLKAQIELTRKFKTSCEFNTISENKLENANKAYVLIIGQFTSHHCSKEQLIEIFMQSNITIRFIDDIIGATTPTSSQPITCATTHIAPDSSIIEKLIEENRALTDKLAQMQQTLLQSEEKNKHLEELIQTIKAQKQSKSIKYYFGK